jgi:hypothetical protein
MPGPGYQHTNLASAASFLSLRLSDSPQRFYTTAEQYNGIREALRIWNVLTSHDRARGTIAVTSPTSFYSLTASLKDGTGTLLRPQTIKDSDILAEIKAHLMEDNLATDMFTVGQMVDAIQWGRDQFIADTAIVLTSRSDFVGGGGPGVFDFPDSVIGIRRAVWSTPDGRYVPLARSDERSATAFNRNWRSPGTPRSYSISASPSLRTRLIPPPSTNGNLNTWVTASGPALDPTQAVTTVLGIPDDFCWAVKYSAISTLLGSDGPGSDPDRAKRADKMYQLGVAMARKIATVLYAELDGIPVIPSTIYKTDRFQGGWEGKRLGAPTVLSIVGPDTIAVTPVPDTAPHSILLDVVRNTIVPIAVGDFLQIGREQLGAVLGMAQWICTFKCGGEELQVADEYYDQFFEEAEHYAFQRSAASSAITAMRQSADQPTEELPMEIDATEGVRNADEIQQERNARRRSTTQ